MRALVRRHFLRMLEGIVSKRADAPYAPGNRGFWVDVKCLQREEFVVIGWTDPEGTRPRLGALLLAYYDPGGRLVYAGRAGTGSSRRSWNGCGAPCSRSPRPMPLEVPPPRASRFRWPLVLSRVHCVRPALVAEISHLDGRQPAAAGRLRGPARGQAGGKSPPPDAASKPVIALFRLLALSLFPLAEGAIAALREVARTR